MCPRSVLDSARALLGLNRRGAAERRAEAGGVVSYVQSGPVLTREEVTGARELGATPTATCARAARPDEASRQRVPSALGDGRQVAGFRTRQWTGYRGGCRPAGAALVRCDELIGLPASLGRGQGAQCVPRLHGSGVETSGSGATPASNGDAMARPSLRTGLLVPVSAGGAKTDTELWPLSTHVAVVGS